jgi:hypothetical protein
MTPNEFKAWFDGFTEAFDGKIPTKAQWDRIKARVADIDGKALTERVYVDRYWPTHLRLPYWTTYYGTTGGCGAVSGNSTLSNASSQYQGAIGSGGVGSTFNSSHAMAELGRAEAATIS